MVGEHNVARLLAVTLVASLLTACGPGTTGPSAGTSASPAARLTASPPATVASGFGRLQGTVRDINTSRPVADACVVIATEGTCQPGSPRTDDNGFWWIDLPAGVDWDVSWQKTGYEIAKLRITTKPEVQTLDVQLKPAS